MTKELNFNIDEIRAENRDFERWQEEMRINSKTWYGCFFKGDNTTYVAMVSGNEEHVILYPNMSFEEVKRRVKLNYFYHNLDGTEHRGFAKDMIDYCYNLAVERWNKDTGRTRVIQVKEQGR